MREDLKDQINALEILKKLFSDSKLNFSQISKELDITRKTLKKYLGVLRREKIINDFTININPNINPDLMYVIVEFKTNPNEPKLIERLLKIQQIKMLDGILGDFSLIALFIFRESSEFNQILKNIDNIMSSSYFKKYTIISAIKIYKTNGIDISFSQEFERKKIDQIDILILRILQYEQDSKLISTYEISEILNRKFNIQASQSTIYNRIKSLEENDIIINHCINFNPLKLGFKGKYILRIKPKNPSHYDELAVNLIKKKEITDLFRIGEQYGLFAIVRVKEIEEYGRFIKNLYDSEQIEDTYSNFVLDERISYTNFLLN